MKTLEEEEREEEDERSSIRFLRSWTGQLTVAWVTVSLVDGHLAVAMLMSVYQRHERERLPVKCVSVYLSVCVCVLFTVTLWGRREARAFNLKCHAN